MRYKAVLFDLDGTILDTISELAITMNEVRRSAGLEPQPVEAVRAMVGNGIRNLIKRSTAGEDVDQEQLHTLFMNYYNVHCCENTYPYPGVFELLLRLKMEGCKLAVVSNKADGPSNILVENFFPGVFDCVRGHREDTPLKPNREVIDSVLGELGVDASDAVYVGDSEVDIQTAANSGMPCISVDWGFKSHEFLVDHKASCIVSDMIELAGEL